MGLIILYVTCPAGLFWWRCYIRVRWQIVETVIRRSTADSIWSSFVLRCRSCGSNFLENWSAGWRLCNTNTLFRSACSVLCWFHSAGKFRTFGIRPFVSRVKCLSVKMRLRYWVLACGVSISYRPLSRGKIVFYGFEYVRQSVIRLCEAHVDL